MFTKMLAGASLCLLAPLAPCFVGCAAPPEDGSATGDEAITGGAGSGADDKGLQDKGSGEIAIRILMIDCGVTMDLGKMKPGSCDQATSCGLNRKMPAGSQQVCIVYSSSSAGKQNNAYIFDQGAEYLTKISTAPGSYQNATLLRALLPSVPITSIVYDVFGDDYYHYGTKAKHPEKCENLYEMSSYCSPAGYFSYDARGIDPSKVLKVTGPAPTNG